MSGLRLAVLTLLSQIGKERALLNMDRCRIKAQLLGGLRYMFVVSSIARCEIVSVRDLPHVFGTMTVWTGKIENLGPARVTGRDNAPIPAMQPMPKPYSLVSQNAD